MLNKFLTNHKISISLILLLFSITTSAQKQTYLLLAYGQKSINMVCGEKLLLKNEEVTLMPAETMAYRSQTLTETRANLGKGYANIFVELIPAGNAVIFYEFKRVYTTQKDGWNCTNTQYGLAKGKDLLSAEKVFAAQQAEYKNVEYKEVFRWGKPATYTPSVIGENDLKVNWINSSQKHLLQLENIRNDVALEVTVVQYKKGSNTSKGNETDLSKMVKTNETTITLEPGIRSQNILDRSAGFEIRINQKPGKVEKQGLIDKTKQLIKSYITNTDGKVEAIKTTSIGVRG